MGSTDFPTKLNTGSGMDEEGLAVSIHDNGNGAALLKACICFVDVVCGCRGFRAFCLFLHCRENKVKWCSGCMVVCSRKALFCGVCSADYARVVLLLARSPSQV